MQQFSFWASYFHPTKLIQAEHKLFSHVRRQPKMYYVPMCKHMYYGIQNRFPIAASEIVFLSRYWQLQDCFSLTD